MIKPIYNPAYKLVLWE